MTTLVYFPLSIVSACHPFLVVPVSPVSIYNSAASVMMLSLSPVMAIVPTADTDLAILIEISFIVSRLTVIDISDVVCSHLSSERCVQAITVAETIPFIVEFDTYFSAV